VIYSMARDLEDRLRARKFPVRVIYGPERTMREGYDTAIVLERDRGGSDTVRAATGVQNNARKLMTRGLAVRATIYAASTLPGAMVQDHEHLCEQLVDAVLVEIFQWQTGERAGALSIAEARYLAAADRNDVETWPGVVYVLRFAVPRAVFVKTFEGAAKPTYTLPGFQNRTNVSAPGYAPEVGCDDAHSASLSVTLDPLTLAGTGTVV
jgi:hypothetical protein